MDELISDVLRWTTIHWRACVGQSARTYLHLFCANTGSSLEDLPGERESVKNPCCQRDLMMMMMMMMICLECQEDDASYWVNFEMATTAIRILFDDDDFIWWWWWWFVWNAKRMTQVIEWILKLQPQRSGFYLMILFTNPSARAGYDTRSVFKRSLTGLNSEFSFS